MECEDHRTGWEARETCRRNLLGLCELRCKELEQTVTDGIWLCGTTKSREKGVGFLVHRDMAKAVIVFGWLPTIRLRATPFCITMHTDAEMKDHYQQFQSRTNQTSRKDKATEGQRSEMRHRKTSVIQEEFRLKDPSILQAFQVE